MRHPRLRIRSAARLAIAMIVALQGVGHARCGDRADDGHGVTVAIQRAIAACPCESGIRSKRCLRHAIRQVRIADGLRSPCRHPAFVSAAAIPCAVGLTGHWMLTGEVLQSGCGFAPVETLLEITQAGDRLTAQGTQNAYSGTSRDDGWELTVPIPRLDRCPTGQPAEVLYRITGTPPDAGGIVNVDQTIMWFSPVGPFDPCPGCAIRWRGTMVRTSPPP